MTYWEDQPEQHALSAYLCNDTSPSNLCTIYHRPPSQKFWLNIVWKKRTWPHISPPNFYLQFPSFVCNSQFEKIWAIAGHEDWTSCFDSEYYLSRDNFHYLGWIRGCWVLPLGSQHWKGWAGIHECVWLFKGKIFWVTIKTEGHVYLQDWLLVKMLPLPQFWVFDSAFSSCLRFLQTGACWTNGWFR